MTDPINFDIEALAVRYELHPERRDIFIEGERDQGLVRTLLEHEGRDDVSVFAISVVNVSPHLVLEKDLPHPSRRSEVITLALELEARNVPQQQAVCIADADFDYLIPSNIVCSLLLLTDFTSMELYAFTEETIHKVLVVSCPNTESSGSQLLGDLRGPLQFLFSARAANYALKVGLSWIDNIDRFFQIENGRIQFDQDEFLKRYVLDRVPHPVAASFDARLQEIQAILSSDVRCRIRGHDFVKLLTWYLRKAEDSKYLNEDSVRQMLYLTISLDDLGQQSMFGRLLARIV